MRTNSNGNCDRRAGIQLQGIRLCEENPDGTVDCTGTAIMTSNEGQCNNIILLWNSDMIIILLSIKINNGLRTNSGITHKLML